jgi:RNA polymerase sigma-70 factor (ECF subfamily)
MQENKLNEEFLVLINQNKGIIYRISRSYGETEADQEDLFQEILLNLWKGFTSFRNESKFSTWLYRIALNTCITAFRKKNRIPNSVSMQEKHKQIPDNQANADYTEDIRLLYNAISKLDKLEKAIIILYLEEKSYEEIAEIAGITPNHAGVKIARIKARLRQYLNHENL